jgi:sortase A
VEGLAAAEDEPATPVAVEEGDPIATLDIPAIGLRKTVVEGTSRDALRTGPGHYRGTALPGRTGNAAIAGHRTTHGAPFFDIDRLEPGDEIVVETVDGRFTYIVEGHDDGHGGRVGHLVVAPDEVWVIADRGDDRLTLTACHPAYSARQRIVVTALLDGFAAGAAPTVTEAHLAVPPIAEPAAPSTSTASTSTPAPEAAPAMTDTGLGWQTDHLGTTLTWVGATTLIVLAAAAVGRLWRRWPAYAVASPPFGLALFTCFTHLDRLLPAA